MKSKPAVSPASPADPRDPPLESERDQISQNIEAVLEFYAREEQKISRSQRILDPEAAVLQQSMNPDLVLAALDERGDPDEQSKAAGQAKEDAGGKE